ncbi:MAG: fimbrillin family protein [Dysgonamonadaceae bacterium]|nr:fimbrillin family protein [Dysgonamonadaceae bacterium]
MKREKTYFRGWPVLPTALIVLLPLFAACDGLDNGQGGGRKTAVEFSLGEIAPWSATTELRGGSETPRVIETASVPLEDNWVLEASLVEDPVAPTRAIAGLNDGAVIHIIARNTSTSEITESNYQYLSDKIVPVGQAMELEDGPYSFTAYSYNTSAVTLPGTLSSDYPNPDVTLSPYVSPIDRGNDLLLSSNTVTKSGSSGINLGILKHKFSRVIYDVSFTPAPASYNVDKVELSPNYTAKLTKSTDDFAINALTTAQPLDLVNYSYVYTPAPLLPTLKISVTINSTKQFIDVPVTYKKTLEAGKSYTLKINITQGRRWAGSNIYWVEDPVGSNTGYLTFATHGTTDKQFYQGLFFRWGSLVGVSSAQTNIGTESSPSYTDDFDVNKTYIYVPENPTANPPTWKRTTLKAARTAYGWNTHQFSRNYDFDYIPAVNVTLSSVASPSRYDNYLARNYVIGDDASGGHDPGNYRGDICKYLTGQPNVPAGNWVMPTTSDIEAVDGFRNPIIPTTGDYWLRVPQSGGFSSATVYSTDGSYNNWTWGALYGSSSSGTSATVFPASGFRGDSPPDGRLRYVGVTGCYWTGTAMHNAVFGVDMLLFITNDVSISTGDRRWWGYSVRCLLQH